MRTTTPAPATTVAPVDRKYLLERVGEAAVVQVYADGFRDLPLREKTLVWHLAQAAIAGRDIFYDQRYAHNLDMRDVLDHQTQAADRIASYDEMLSSLVQAALAKVGMQQNTDMRKITAWAAMAAVPTMIAGIYGMNFDNMPELHWQWGYPLVVLVMATICGFLYRNFRRNHWL